MTKGTFELFDGEERRVFVLKGREEWALSHLIAAGEAGCTPIDTPGPRWSHYVWLLRGRGIDVVTITEAHGGPYAGHHARYVLKSDVRRAGPEASGSPPKPLMQGAFL